jgi:streptogramin lyase
LGPVVTATCTGGASPITCTYIGYNTSALASGAHTITATSLADGNYAAATGTNTLTVAPLPTIVFTVPNHHTMDTPFAVSATSNSSGAITYSVLSGPATIAGSTVTLTGVASTVTLQASQAASGSYAAGSQTASFLVIAGSVWLGNGTGSVSAFDLTGVAISGSGGFTGAGVGTIAMPLGLAVDSSGDMWVANSNGVSAFTRQGIAISSTAFTGGGISNPAAVAIDGSGQVWVANANGTVSVLSNAGTAVSPSGGYPGVGTPSGIAVDISGSVWIPSRTGNTVTRILGATAPAIPLATGASSGPGVKP